MILLALYPIPRLIEVAHSPHALARRVAERMVAQVSAECGVTPKEIWSRNRSRRVAHPRQLVLYRLRQERTQSGRPRYSYPTIAAVFGLDHTTVMHAERAVAKRQAERMAAE